MKYIPYVASFAFFFVVGLACAGAVSWSMLLRGLAVGFCALACLSIAEAYRFKQHIKPAYVPRRTMTGTARELLLVGTVVTIDLLTGDVTKAAS
jgi:hypothetical protein